MCFAHYEDDVLEGLRAGRISCKCGRWLHEDCVEDVIKDNDDDMRYCSFCVENLPYNKLFYFCIFVMPCTIFVNICRNDLQFGIKIVNAICSPLTY